MAALCGVCPVHKENYPRCMGRGLHQMICVDCFGRERDDIISKISNPINKGTGNSQNGMNDLANLRLTEPQDAQNMTYTLPRQIQLQQRVELEPGKYLGCYTLPSGMVVVNDRGSIKLINSDGTLNSTIKGKTNPFDSVTLVDDDLLAASHIIGNTISTISVSRGEVIQSWMTSNHSMRVMGIFHIGGYIIICVPLTGFKKLNTATGSVDNVIKDKDVDGLSRVVASSDRICYTCPHIHTVTVLNHHNDVIFTHYTRSLERPLGVSIDSRNNVYVTGYNSNNVLVISPDGQKMHQLLGKENMDKPKDEEEEDSLCNPTGIHYNSHNKQLIVITRETGTLCKYALTCETSLV